MPQRSTTPDSATETPVGPWPHRLAVLLACATFPLIWVGGLVTTTDAGMAVPDWPGTYGYNLFLYPWTTWLSGPWDIFVEHGHRQLGALVGLLTLILALVLWLREPRRWVRWLGLAAVAAVIGQGVLGGLRVIQDDRLLAQVHGTTGPAFFALAVALVVFTARCWRTAQPREFASAGRLQRLACITTALAYLQLAVGARVRHMPPGGSSAEFQAIVAFHLVLAALVTAHIGLLAARVGRLDPPEPTLWRPAMALVVLIAIQLLLGAGTWVSNFGWPAWFARFAWADSHVIQARGLTQSLVTTAHVANGSLIVAGSLVVALRSLRLLRSPAIVRVSARPAEAAR